MAKIVIAPDSFKGTLAARAASEALARGWLAVRPRDDVRIMPIADGGEGTLEALASAGTVRHPVSVLHPTEPLGGRRIDAEWLELPATRDAPRTGVVELAAGAGIELVDRLAPLEAHTYGFGQLIADALDHGVERLLLGLGGSCSTDGGAGALLALGARLNDVDGSPVPLGVAGLEQIASAELAGMRAIPAAGAVVLSDVTNPLLGELGAAAVFGPQKGAGPDLVPRLDAALARWADLLPVSADAPGAGAAGGTGFAMIAWGAEISSGAAMVAKATSLESELTGAELVITGEGSYDAQSAAGKAPSVVAGIAERLGVRVAIVAGRASVNGPGRVLSLTELAGSADEAMARTAHWLEVAGQRLAEEFSAEDPAEPDQ